MNAALQNTPGTPIASQRPYAKWLHWAALGGLPVLLAGVLSGCGSSPAALGASSNAGGTAAKQAANSNAAAAAKNAEVAAVFPKASFRADLPNGRDPFYPGNRRTTVHSSAATESARLPLISYLKLVGIRPGTLRPMALINKTALGPGEEGNVSIVVSNQLSKAEVQKVNVRCLEIRQNSVLISIEGEQDVKELRLAQGK